MMYRPAVALAFVFASAGAAAAQPASGPPPAPAPDDAKLAAIQKAMNDLAPAVQSCWAAAAAAERYDIAGELVASIDIGAGSTPTKVAFARDTVRDAALGACVSSVLVAYRWAPPLAGQSIQLPFQFRAPDGQSVIDRRLVPAHAQGKLAVAVVLDQANTGNAGAALFDVTLAAGGTTGLRWADRDELWYFASEGALIAGAADVPRPVAAGTFVYVPQGGVRAISAGAADLHAVLVLVPGGREGIARAGALPNREVTTWRRPPTGPQVVTTGAHGPFTAEVVHVRDLPAHADPHGTDLYYVLAGSGTLTVGGTQVAITPTSAIQIPPGVERALHADGELTAIEIHVKTHP